MTIAVETNAPAIIYPTADELDSGGWAPNSGVKLRVYLDPRGDVPVVRAEQGINIGIPFAAHHKRLWQLFALGQDVVGASVLDFLRSHEAAIIALADCYEGTEWDGSNHIGQWSADACDPFPCGVDPSAFANYWRAEDWLYDSNDLDGTETNSELDAKAVDLVTEAEREGAFVRLDDVRDVLEEWRDEARERNENED